MCLILIIGGNDNETICKMSKCCSSQISSLKIISCLKEEMYAVHKLLMEIIKVFL